MSGFQNMQVFKPKMSAEHIQRALDCNVYSFYYGDTKVFDSKEMMQQIREMFEDNFQIENAGFVHLSIDENVYKSRSFVEYIFKYLSSWNVLTTRTEISEDFCLVLKARTFKYNNNVNNIKFPIQLFFVPPGLKGSDLLDMLNCLGLYEKFRDQKKSVEKIIEKGFQDRMLHCKICTRSFLFSAGEQKFFKEKNFLDPYSCKCCRKKRRNG